MAARAAAALETTNAAKAVRQVGIRMWESEQTAMLTRDPGDTWPAPARRAKATSAATHREPVALSAAIGVCNAALLGIALWSALLIVGFLLWSVL